ncbi:hypothetical protein NDU88_006550 [Pleurodeles waltl]|uniref:Uncharacterized protein n=1 Tax=Pleurodeles waltl TaxID=8319 RepID=A0AAV7MZK0_PLEWA|nr:hypothetical protein NDU88_006550 [Pleurodeles waltl]
MQCYCVVGPINRNIHPGLITSCPGWYVERTPDRRQRVPTANPEKEVPKEEGDTNAEEEDGKETREEERPVWGRETRMRKRVRPKTLAGRSRDEKGTQKEKQVPARAENPNLWTQQPTTSPERRG